MRFCSLIGRRPRLSWMRSWAVAFIGVVAAGSALSCVDGSREKFTMVAQWCAPSAAEGSTPVARQVSFDEPAPEPDEEPDESSQLAPQASAAQGSLEGIAKTRPSSVPREMPRSTRRAVSLVADVAEPARPHDIDPLLLHAIAEVESRHDQRALSPAGARGLMQVMPATAQRFGVREPMRELFDVRTNLGASAAYLKWLQKRYGNDLQLVLAAYNAGEGAVEKYGLRVPPYRETQRYVSQVLERYLVWKRQQARLNSLASSR